MLTCLPTLGTDTRPKSHDSKRETKDETKCTQPQTSLSDGRDGEDGREGKKGGGEGRKIIRGEGGKREERKIFEKKTIRCLFTSVKSSQHREAGVTKDERMVIWL